MDHWTRGERAALLQPTPDVQVDGQLVLSGSRIEVTENSSEPEVEESAESAGNQITNHGELDTVDVQRMESDIDDDASHDTAVAVRIDLLSLQRKVSKIAASVLAPAIASQEQLSAEASLQGSTLEERSAGESTSQRPPSTTEDRASSPS